MRSSRAAKVGVVSLVAVVVSTLLVWFGGRSEGPPPSRYGLSVEAAEKRTSAPLPVGPARAENRIALVEDLVLGLSETDPNNVFNRPTDVAVDGEGRIYVLDTGNRRVQVFAGNGDYLRTLGQQGEGPGDFASVTTLTVFGDQVVVVDGTLNRLSVWSTSGLFQGAYSNKLGGQIRNVIGTANGELFAVYRTSIQRDGDGLNVFSYALAEITPQGAELSLYIALEHGLGFSVRREIDGSVSARGLRLGNYYPGFAVAPDGSVYVSAAAEYEVAALRPEGGASWLLRGTWERKTITPQEIDHLVETSAIDLGAEGVSLGGLDRVQRHPALSDWQPITVDGRGFVYVFPHVPFFWEVAEWPVDVYTPEGEHIFSGTIPARTWSAVSNGFIYGTMRDDESGERAVVRWRLETPF